MILRITENMNAKHSKFNIVTCQYYTVAVPPPDREMQTEGSADLLSDSH